MRPDWTQVTVEHVHQACGLFDSGTAVPSRGAKSTFLVVNGKTYPAKFIRGLAYRLATGVELDPSQDYSGGLETIRFFESLGFSTPHDAASEPVMVTPVEVPAVPPAPPTALKEHREPQKRALAELLRRRFGTVQTEAEFPWLTVPAPVDMDKALTAIFNALSKMRGFTDFITPGKSLRCDFFISSERLIVEYDERQHFTEQRAKALELYPGDMPLDFDRDQWIAACRTIKATDPTPPHRDEQRAFYDSLRDILATRNSLRLVRLRFGTHDWTAADVAERLDAVLGTAPVTVPSQAQVSPNPTDVTLGKAADCWVATLLLEQQEQDEEQDFNQESLHVLTQTVEQTLDRMSGAGVILFPAGWFWSGPGEAVTLYDWAANEISRLLSGRASNSVVCVGIDGNCNDSDRPAQDQTAVAISSKGIIAAARKFWPTAEEDGYIISAPDPLEGERGWERVFSISGLTMYLSVCYDVYGISNGGLENPGVDVILDLAHQFNPHGEGSSGVSYFARLGFAGAAKRWHCMVVGSALFVRRPVPESWPSGVRWNQGDILPKKWKYGMNPVRPFDTLLFGTNRGRATVRIYYLN